MADDKKVAMKYKPLGNGGVQVSEICLGTMTFGLKDKNQWGLPTTTEEPAHEMLDIFFERGGNFIDTANVYGAGESEQVIGNWLVKRSNTIPRENMVIATKVAGAMGKGKNQTGLSRKAILWAVDESLKRLQTPYIDLYQCHEWSSKVPLKETLSTLNDLVRIGKVRYIGLSNFTGWQVQKALDISEKYGFEAFITAQQQYNLMCRDIELDSMKVTVDNGLGTLCWSPLAGGWLTGRYKRDMQAPTSGGRVEWAEKAGWAATSWSSMATDKNWGILDALLEVAAELKRTPPQVALRWLMQRPGVVAPIIGAKRKSHLLDNLGALEFELSAEQMDKLSSASKQKQLPYPQMLGSQKLPWF